MNTSKEQLLNNSIPTDRENPAALAREQKLIQVSDLLQKTIDAMEDPVLILNSKRQIVSTNKALVELFDRSSVDLLGKRPGEILGCRNATLTPNGCGGSENCKSCGAVKAILGSQETNQRITQEARILLTEAAGSALDDLRVSATTAIVEGEAFTITVIKDISAEKRLEVLTRLFFHDVIGMAGNISGLADILSESLAHLPEGDEAKRISRLSDQLVEEIQAQRDLAQAETGDLKTSLKPVNTHDVLVELQGSYSKHPVARERNLVIADGCHATITTDERLLRRVLGNMIKNALEASLPGGQVAVACIDNAKAITFQVHNDGVIPKEVQAQIFHRSFSTKATSGRGIGTHSMKLFGERYLGGKVDFTSEKATGTTFKFTLPKY